MIPPSKRIHIFPDRTFTRPRDVEILVLGEPEAIATLVADLRATLEHWEGFEQVHPIVMGDQMLGFRVSRSKWAFHDDPVAEALRLFSSPLLAQHRVEWWGIADGAADGALGAVGSW